MGSGGGGGGGGVGGRLSATLCGLIRCNYSSPWVTCSLRCNKMKIKIWINKMKLTRSNVLTETGGNSNRFESFFDLLCILAFYSDWLLYHHTVSVSSLPLLATRGHSLLPALATRGHCQKFSVKMLIASCTDHQVSRSKILDKNRWS